MGILKIGQRGVGGFCNQISDFNVKDMKMKKSNIHGIDYEDQFDDNELAEMGCELGMVEGQFCNIPYELYDLPNLREILSLETWNSCLTEEERFSLSAYLPDMDQQTFWLTMKELLGGSDLYFGNPLDTFFKRLKAGFYPPKVTSLRECLQFMQRRKYYHLLRSYQDNMAEMFKEMSRLWNQCERSISNQERIHMWRTRRKHKGNNLLDLNTIPEDGDFLCEETNSDAPLHHLSKKINSVGSKRSDNIFSSLSANGMKFISPNCNAKGSLKLKESFYGSVQNPYPKITASDILEKSRTQPKGLLKVVPKVPFRLDNTKVVQRQPQPTLLASGKGLVDTKISSLPAPVYFRDTVGQHEYPLLQQKVGDVDVHTTLEEPQCVLNQQESAIKTSRYSESSTLTRKIKREMNPSLDDVDDLGVQKLSRSNAGRASNVEYESLMDSTSEKRYRFGGKNYWQNLGLGSKGISESSLIQFPFRIQCYGGEWQIKPKQEEHVANHPRISDMVSNNSNLVVGKRETYVASPSDQMKAHSDACVKISEKLTVKPGVSERSKAEPTLPLTYKRRKAQVKHNSLQFGKPLTTGLDLNTATSS